MAEAAAAGRAAEAREATRQAEEAAAAGQAAEEATAGGTAARAKGARAVQVISQNLSVCLNYKTGKIITSPEIFQSLTEL